MSVQTVSAKTVSVQKSPIGMPRGWFVVGFSQDLFPGTVVPVHYFDRQLVMFRDEDLHVVVLDAYCPHLGAHLGHGGCVKGNTVVCPFHAWAFDATGACVEIPYATKIPARARVRSYPVQERFDVIFVWFDPAGGPPAWELPEIPEYGTSAWTAWYPNLIRVKTHPREIVENVADSAHFPTVHQTHVSLFENIYEGHKATQHTKGTATPPKGGTDAFEIWATYHGPAFQLSDMKGVLHVKLLLAHTPIDDGQLDLRFAVTLKKAGARTDEFAELYVENLRLGFHQDIAIWEHKVFRPVPRLVEGDGPLGKLRKWYSQFYQEAAPAAS